jgi:hypothetical protein
MKRVDPAPGTGVSGVELPGPRSRHLCHEGYVSFCPGRVDACRLDDERGVPQQGDCSGGWITSEVVGPFEGAPDIWGW